MSSKIRGQISSVGKFNIVIIKVLGEKARGNEVRKQLHNLLKFP